MHYYHFTIKAVMILHWQNAYFTSGHHHPQKERRKKKQKIAAKTRPLPRMETRRGDGTKYGNDAVRLPGAAAAGLSINFTAFQMLIRPVANLPFCWRQSGPGQAPPQAAAQVPAQVPRAAPALLAPAALVLQALVPPRRRALLAPPAQAAGATTTVGALAHCKPPLKCCWCSPTAVAEVYSLPASHVVDQSHGDKQTIDTLWGF